MDRWIGGRTNDEWMDEWVDGWMDGWMMDGWMDGWMDYPGRELNSDWTSR